MRFGTLDFVVTARGELVQVVALTPQPEADTGNPLGVLDSAINEALEKLQQRGAREDVRENVTLLAYGDRDVWRQLAEFLGPSHPKHY